MVEGVPAVNIGSGEPKLLESSPSGVIAVAQSVGGGRHVWTYTDGKTWPEKPQFTDTHGAEVLGAVWAGNRWLAYGTAQARPDRMDL